MKRSVLTPYQKIMQAAELGIGLKLSQLEVQALSRDHAIVAVAEDDDRKLLGEEK